jgi:hypothetical protein
MPRVNSHQQSGWLTEPVNAVLLHHGDLDEFVERVRKKNLIESLGNGGQGPFDKGDAMSRSSSMDRTRVTKSTLQLQRADEFLSEATAAERMRMVWQLTLDAWAFKEPNVAESRFQRHAIRVVRGES